MLEIGKRKDIYTDIKELKKKVTAEITTGLVCLVFIALAIVYIPNVSTVSKQAPVKQYGSLILSMPIVGYVVIAILFFILGVAATLLCRHYKEIGEKEKEL